MKVQELFEGKGYANRVGVEPLKSRAADGSKLGKMQGGTDDWLEAINARMKTPITKTDIRAAGPEIEASAAYKALLKAGWTDISTSAATNNGTFVMKRADGQKYHILWTGKINDRTQSGGGIRASTVPHIVPNDPVATVSKTMQKAMKHLASKSKQVQESILAEGKESVYAGAKASKIEWLVKMLDAAGSKKLKDGSMWDADETGDGIWIPVKQALQIIEKLKAAGYVSKKQFTSDKWPAGITFFADSKKKSGISIGYEDPNAEDESDPKAYSFYIFDEE